MSQRFMEDKYKQLECLLTNDHLRPLHGNGCLLYTPISTGYLFLEAIFFVSKYLIKFLFVYFFSCMSTIKNINATCLI